MLPESLCNLSNLITLILYECRNLLQLPKGFCNLINLQYLDIRETNKLEEMPLGIGDMKKLLILGEIVAGKINGARMLGLWKIPNLGGRQHILELQNVRNVEEVACWKMGQLEGIDILILEWSDTLDDSRNEENEEVLSALKPQKNIMEPSIESYGGREMPSWIGDPWFGKMKILTLCHCNKVASLPALSQLPSLEELTIQGMNGVKEVGMTFYGNVPSSTNVFPSLKILRICNMAELYEWSNYSIDEGRAKSFPKMKKLVLVDCPKLEVFSFEFPNLDELDVRRCKEVILRSKSITSGIQRLTSLEKLSVAECPQLQSLPRLGLPTSLELLQIYECPILEKQCRKGKGVFWPIVASIPSFSLHSFLVWLDKPQRLQK